MNIDEIKRRKIEAERRQDNKQHAAKIDQGLKSLDTTTSPIRAIWELFQNARDLTDNCQIKITLTENEFIFEHNGKPFDIDSLSSLIKQVSSHSKENETTVGQYGTGFLTTHYFGMRFKLYGSYQIDENKYVELDGFTIDRSHDNIEELIDKISQQIKATDDLIDKAENYALIQSTPEKWTRFVYELPNTHKEKTREAITEGKKLIPMVMLFNPTISYCSINDETEGRMIEFRLIGSRQEFEVNIATIQVKEKLNGMESCKTEDLYYLQSEDKKDTIILPLENRNKARKFSGVPKLFMHFPLIGSECWGCEFIYNSSRFRPTEKRDNLYLPDGNDNNIADAETNKRVLVSMDDMLFNFLEFNVEKIENTINLAPLYFNARHYEVPQTRDFIEKRQKDWCSIFTSLPLISTKKGRLAVVDKTQVLSVYDEEIVRFLSEDDNKKYTDVLYQYASNIKDCLLPEEDECLQWSEIINGWDNVEQTHRISLKDIANAITNINGDLFAFLEFLKKIGKSNYFNIYPIIPNREGELILAQNLRDAKSIPNELYELIKNLIPNETRSFVNENFVGITEFATYNRQNLRKDLSAKMQELRQRISNNSVIAMELSHNEIESLMLYCSSFPSEADSIRRRIMPFLCRLNGVEVEEQLIPNEYAEEVDIYEQTFALLLEHSLYTIQNRRVLDMQNISLYGTIICEVSKSETYKGLLEKYAIFPNEEKELCNPTELMRNNIEVSKQSDIYKWVEVVLGRNLKSELVDQEFSSFYEFAVLDTKSICLEIQSKLLDEDNTFSNNKTIILEIIEKIDESKGYEELFKEINKHKEELFFQCAVSGEKKKDVYTLMKQNESTLSELALLSVSPDFMAIIQRAQNLLQQERQEQIDFAYKKMLGKYVENELRKKLNSSLIECNINDIQGGQDIVISKDGQSIYFIEVKSRWSTDQSVRMSTTQHIKSVENKKKYALCAIDMTDFSREQAICGKEMDLEQFEEFSNHIKCIANIGELNEVLISSVANSSDNVHIESGYSVVVPQKLIQTGITIDELIEKISNGYDSV